MKCQSEYYLQLRGHSERELQIGSSELRKRYQNHTQEVAITAKRLADLLASAEAYEEVLTQRLHDLEARDVFARMGGSRIELAEQEQLPAHPVHAPTLSPQQASQPTADGRAAERVNALDDDDEELEEYEEYR